MKNLKYITLATLLLLGCDDKLEMANPNRQTTAGYWSTQEQALAGINAVYNGLIVDGTYMRMFPAATDGRGDDFTGDSPWGDLVQIGNFTIPTTSAPIEWVWNAHYVIVFRANQVLANVPEIEMDEALKNRIKGQAHFLRGLAYFNLANTYGAVPVITVPASGEEEYYAPTATEEALWGQVIADFQQAQELLPVNYNGVGGPDEGQVGRATKGAATGMLGKAYLYREQWQQAATEFEKLISGPLNVYSLVPNYRDNFSPYTENNPESLFEVQFATVDQVGGSDLNWAGDPTANWKQVSAEAVTYGADGFGYSDFLPTRWIYNAFKEEKTEDDNVDPRLLATLASFEPGANSTTIYGNPWPYAPDAIYPRKYTNDGFGYPHEYDINSGINYRVLRYADILLMYAEALNEMGRTAEAYQYVQQVRDRVNLPNLATAKPNMSQQEFRDQLGHERALEFAVEGQRINDIIRWGWLYNPEKLEMLIAHDKDFATWTPGNEYLPIPQRELDVNPNLLPNSAND